MRITEQPVLVWIWVLAGLMIPMAATFSGLKKAGLKLYARAGLSLLPGALALAAAKAGFFLLPYDGMTTDFAWCYTTGLLGAAVGVALAARAAGMPAAGMTDRAAPGFCAGMALARIAQRWAGIVGVGIDLDEGWPSALVYFNEWDEPMLAVFIVEAVAALVALGVLLLLSRFRPGAPGVKTGRALTLLTALQILPEQFRNGFFLRWRMVRTEQVFCALVILGVLILLGYRLRRSGETILRAYRAVPVMLALTAGIALEQFALDGKMIEQPPWVSWTFYALMVAALPVLEEIQARRLNGNIKEGHKA